MLWISFILALVRIGLDDATMATTLPSWTLGAHKACLQYMDSHGYSAIYRGLLCGDSRLPLEVSSLFKSTGLYHLLVVSGSHFVFLEHLLQRLFKKNHLLHFLVFIFFGAVCLFQPPVTRALVSLSLRSLSRRFQLFWTPEQVTLFSGLWCLILCPQWSLSFSLLLSWTASLALLFFKRPLHQHGMIFLSMIPFFPNIHPSSILNNLIAAPLLGTVHFPLTVATAIIPPLASIGNDFWAMTYSTMEILPQNPNSGSSLSPLLPLFALWMVIFTGHVFLFSKRIFCRF